MPTASSIACVCAAHLLNINFIANHFCLPLRLNGLNAMSTMVKWTTVLGFAVSLAGPLRSVLLIFVFRSIHPMNLGWL